MPKSKKKQVVFFDMRTRLYDTMLESVFVHKVRMENLICTATDDINAFYGQKFGKDADLSLFWCPAVHPRPFVEFTEAIKAISTTRKVTILVHDKNAGKFLGVAEALQQSFENEQSIRLQRAQELLDQSGSTAEGRNASTNAKGGDEEQPAKQSDEQPAEEEQRPEQPEGENASTNAKGGDEEQLAKQRDKQPAEEEQRTEQPEGESVQGGGFKQPAEQEQRMEQPQGETSRLQAEEGWFQVAAKGKYVSTVDLLVDLRNRVMGIEKEVKDGLKVVTDGLQEVKDELKDGLQEVKDGLKEAKDGLQEVKVGMQKVNLALSMTFEHSCRSSFSLFLENRLQLNTLHPVCGKKLPNISNFHLENVAVLCLKDVHKVRSMPDYAEIDVLVKLNKGHSGGRYESPLSGQQNSARDARFMHVAIGEITRSESLCCSKEKFKHPSSPEYTASSKLLYKFVQLERGLIAAQEFYRLAADNIVGAAIISPSFRAISEPQELIAAVLEGYINAFTHISRLHNNNSMWLLDV